MEWKSEETKYFLSSFPAIVISLFVSKYFGGVSVIEKGLRWRMQWSERSPLKLRVQFSLKMFSMRLEPSTPLWVFSGPSVPPPPRLTGWVRIK